jgi:hypothetical protein
LLSTLFDANASRLTLTSTQTATTITKMTTMTTKTMDPISANWQDFFLHWPEQLPRRGVVVASYQEQIPFDNFLTKGDVILFERRAPDALGARKVLIQYCHIMAVKIVDPVKVTVFQAAGFELPETASDSAPVATPRAVPSTVS